MCHFYTLVSKYNKWALFLTFVNCLLVAYRLLILRTAINGRESNYSARAANALCHSVQGYYIEEICSRQVSESGQKKVLLLRDVTQFPRGEIVRCNRCQGTDQGPRNRSKWVAVLAIKITTNWRDNLLCILVFMTRIEAENRTLLVELSFEPCEYFAEHKHIILLPRVGSYYYLKV